MKLLTKEWYQTMADSGLGVQVLVDARAAEFSEELFRETWEDHLEAWLQMRKVACPILEQVFDEAQERLCFAENYRRNLHQLRTRLPEEILAKVADLRVLALGIATREIRADLEEFRNRRAEQTERIMKRERELRIANGLDKVWIGRYSLHDSRVLSVAWEGEDLLVEFERDQVDWPQIQTIRFREARILTQEREPGKAWWLYDEIWPAEGGYEIHALLWRDSEVFELTVCCRGTELIWTVAPEFKD